MKHIIPFGIVTLTVLTTGCHGLGGFGYSAHVLREYHPETGKLVRKESKRDLNKLGSVAAFTSKEASAFQHTRTNLTGTVSSTSLGALKSQPSPEAIEAGGKAAGSVIGAAVKSAVQP